MLFKVSTLHLKILVPPFKVKNKIVKNIGFMDIMRMV